MRSDYLDGGQQQVRRSPAASLTEREQAENFVNYFLPAPSPGGEDTAGAGDVSKII